MLALRTISSCHKTKRAFSYFSNTLKDQVLKMGNETSSLEKLQATNCRIVVVGPKSGDDCLLELVNLPKDARILATGANLEELKKDGNLYTEVILLGNLNIFLLSSLSSFIWMCMCTWMICLSVINAK